MKYLFLLAFGFSSLFLQAQKNEFLDRSYWKNNPDVAKVQADIAKGNDPSQATNAGFDATVYAIIESAPDETVKFLLTQKGNDVNKITHDERTYFFWAAYKGNTNLMEHLLSKGAKTKIRDDKGFTPASFAAANGQTNLKVYDICVREGANLKEDLDLEGANALLLAVAFDSAKMELTNYFTAKGLDLNSMDKHGNTAFDYAAKMGNIALLNKLILNGVPHTNSAFIMASKGTRSHTNGLDVYKYLEEVRLKPTTLGRNRENALHAIVTKEKQADVINYFISKGIDINQADADGNTVFMNAASSNPDPQIIETLLTKVTNINQVNNKGISALQLAVKNNSAEIVKILLRNKADVNVSDANGDNLSYYLIQSFNPQKKDVFEAKLNLLKEAGFNIATPQKNGNTLYHLAVEKKELPLIESIQNFKIDINTQNKEGLTALHKAALIAQNDTVLKYLISKGAKKDIKTSFKETAYDIASENEALTKNKVSIDFLK